MVVSQTEQADDHTSLTVTNTASRWSTSDVPVYSVLPVDDCEQTFLNAQAAQQLI